MSAIEQVKKEHAETKAMLINGIEMNGTLINRLHTRLQRLERPWWKKILRRN